VNSPVLSDQAAPHGDHVDYCLSPLPSPPSHASLILRPVFLIRITQIAGTTVCRLIVRVKDLEISIIRVCYKRYHIGSVD
jgi:hypothetical protein